MIASEIIGVFDGSWFDVLTVAGGIVYALLNRRRLTSARPLLSAATGRDFLNGLSVLPLLCLAVGLVSTQALTVLIHGNRLILAGAAVAALLAIVEEPWNGRRRTGVFNSALRPAIPLRSARGGPP